MLYAKAKYSTVRSPLRRRRTRAKHEEVRVSWEFATWYLWNCKVYRDLKTHLIFSLLMQTFEGRELKMRPLKCWLLLPLPAAQALPTAQRPLQWALHLALRKMLVSIIYGAFIKWRTLYGQHACDAPSKRCCKRASYATALEWVALGALDVRLSWQLSPRASQKVPTRFSFTFIALYSAGVSRLLLLLLRLLLHWSLHSALHCCRLCFNPPLARRARLQN